MPASITLSNLGWSTPDGHPVFSDLDLSFPPERTAIVGRNGVGKTSLLRIITGDLLPRTGGVTIRGKVRSLPQIVDVGPDETIAHLFGLSGSLALLAKAESGMATAEELGEADWTAEARLLAALASAGLDAAPDTRLVTLSGGQRTRAALASAIFDTPDFILLDEPTNNLDRDGRRALYGLLDGWRGGALIVSHDRELLDRVDAIVEMTALGAGRYGGNWTAYRARKDIELAAAAQDLATAERRLSNVTRKAQATAERQQRRDGAGAREAASGGMPRILIGARKQRAEATGGANARLAERQRGDADQALDGARRRIEILEPIRLDLASTALASDRVVLRLTDVVAGHVPGAPVLDGLSLTVAGPERIAVAGPNGAGKTTLLDIVAGRLLPWSGEVRRLTRFALLDQRVSLLDPAGSIVANFARLNPGATDNDCRAALARLRFRADAADQLVGTLSGGQRLRAGLACVIGSAAPPPLLLLDEPTNHLDLGSVAAVEAGLNAYDGALLIVSHDQTFLDGVAVTRRIDLGAGRI